jgi:hypothetical protein
MNEWSGPEDDFRTFLLHAEYCDLGDHPKAATYYHFKTGHFEGLRHTL